MLSSPILLAFLGVTSNALAVPVLLKSSETMAALGTPGAAAEASEMYVTSLILKANSFAALLLQNAVPSSLIKAARTHILIPLCYAC